MFNILPVLETIAPIVGGIAGIVSSINDSPSSSSTAPVVVEKPKCEVIEKPQYQPVQMPTIVFNLNIYVNGKKAEVGCSQQVDGICIDSNIE